MNTLILQFRKVTPICLIVCALGCLAPQTQAVVPPPDGVYPNFTTAEGQSALQSLTTGAGNTALGAFALFGTTTGSFNTAVGALALDLNTGDSNTAVGVAALLLNTGTNNTANGTAALVNNSTGIDNTAVGAFALNSNTTAEQNTATGSGALFSHGTGNANTANGANALFNDLSGEANTATGASALANNIAGNSNTACGHRALFNNTGDGQGRGNFNTAVGTGALSSNTTGSDNTAVGVNALANNSTSDASTAVGFRALRNSTGSFEAAFGDNAASSLTSGDGNCAIGESAARDLTMGTANAAIGNSALRNTTTGDHNTAVGISALNRMSPTAGSDNIALGYLAGQNIDGNNNIDIGNAGVAGESDTVRIGGTQTRTFIAGISNATVTGVPVLVDANGQLGVATSSRRFKKELKPMDKASEAVLALKPVTFEYKTDKTSTPQFGLIAEQVAEVSPALVVPDMEGKPYTVRYDAVNAMLLNEFLKEHRKNEKQEATIARLENQVHALTAGLQKLSAQLEVSKPAPQVVNNP
jgi:hypothetical protein